MVPAVTATNSSLGRGGGRSPHVLSLQELYIPLADCLPHLVLSLIKLEPLEGFAQYLLVLKLNARDRLASRGTIRTLVVHVHPKILNAVCPPNNGRHAIPHPLHY